MFRNNIVSKFGFAFVLPLAFAGACGGEVEVDGVLMDQAQADAAYKATFTNVKAKVFSTSCGGVAFCHQRAPFGGGLDLTPANAYNSLVAVTNGQLTGVAAHIAPTKQRVVPGSSAKSFIYQKLTNTIDPNTEGNPMPRSEGAAWHPISASQLALVKSWIDKGALNN